MLDPFGIEVGRRHHTHYVRAPLERVQRKYKSGGGGTNTVVQQSGPPSEVLNNYNEVYGQAKNVAQQPVPQYDGSLIAGFQPQQVAAMNNINTAINAPQPYLNAAWINSLNSTNQLSPENAQDTISHYQNQGITPYLNAASTNIGYGTQASVDATQHLDPWNFGNTVQQYYNPYDNAVIKPTQALFNEQNQEALSNVRGNAVSQGAFGGDREAIAEAETARNQTLAQAPVLANLQAQGYQHATANAQQAAAMQQQTAGQYIQAGQAMGGLGNIQQNSFNSAQSGAQANAWLNSQGAGTMANLGSLAQGLGLQGASAQLQAGSLQQQLAQQELTLPYQQYQSAVAYPQQLTNWLAGTATGLGGASGTQGRTTSPSPSSLSQLGGLGLAGVGLAGQLGAFSGWGAGAGAAGAGTGAAAWSAVGGGMDAAMEAAMAAGAVDAGAMEIPAAAAALAAVANRGGRIQHRADGGQVDWQDPGLTASLGGVGGMSGMGMPARPAMVAGMGYDVGGAVAPSVLASSGGNPLVAGMQERYADVPVEKLQELAIRNPGNAQIQRALMGKRMNPQGYADGGDVDTPDYTHRYNTQLSPGDEREYLNRMQIMSAAQGRDMSKDNFDYDMRGAFASDAQYAPNGHLTDTYKKPNHPTFSTGSQYSGVDGNQGGLWSPFGAGKWAYQPSDTNMKMYGRRGLQEYFDKAEAGNRLMPPRGYADGGLAMNDDAFSDAGGMPSGMSPYKVAEDEGDPSPYPSGMPVGIQLPNFSANVPKFSAPPAPDQQAGMGATVLSDAPVSHDNDTSAVQSFTDDDDAPGTHSDTASGSGHGPWGAIMAAGLGMMSGTSPNALTNIGKGGLAGLQYATNERKMDEQAAYRRATIDSNNTYRQGLLGSRAANTEFRYAKLSSDEAIKQRSQELQSRGLTIREAQNQATNEWHDGVLGARRDQNAATNNYRDRALGERTDYHGAVLSQGREKLDQSAARLVNTQEYQQQRLGLSKSGLDINTQNNIMSNATKMVAADITGRMTLEKAVQQQMAQRSGTGGGGSGSGPAQPPSISGRIAVNPKTGERLRQQPDGSWTAM